MTTQPYNVCIPNHIATESKWDEKASKWAKLGEASSSNHDFKSAYSQSTVCDRDNPGLLHERKLPDE